MNILAIDSSGLVASAAVLSEGVIKAEFSICNKLTHSETLMPMIDEVIKASGVELSRMDAIAVASGPGSFTGLRIGSAVAKGLAEACSVPVVGVPTVEALAQNMCGAEGVIVPLMDARRGETYTGIFRSEGDHVSTVKAQCALPFETIINEVNDLGEKAVFLGDGVKVFREKTEELCSVPHIYAPPQSALQRASSTAVLGERYLQEGRGVDPADHAPVYLRVSQAEREAASAVTEEERRAMAAGHVPGKVR